MSTARGLTTEGRPEALVVGFAVSGQAAATSLMENGYHVRAVDDATGDRLASIEAAADHLGVELSPGPSSEVLANLSGSADLVVLSPGVPPSHAIFGLAPADRMISEVELGWRLLAGASGQGASPLRLAAITGTNGKTTVTMLVTAMLEASGLSALAAGNIGLPLVEIARRRASEATDNPEVVVVEVSSFQLSWTREFRPDVACWLNLAEDHLDWHRDLEHYAAAKARIWQNQRRSDVAVVNQEDAAVLQAAAEAPSRVVTFGVTRGDYRVLEGALVAPDGTHIAAVSELPRSLPHDLANAAAATAVALAAGATAEGCRKALTTGIPMPHRIELVEVSEGVSFFDDSKATTPSAVVAALAGFDSVVLIAGGRNKGLDLTAIPKALAAAGREPGASPRLRAVVAIGESAPELARAFDGRCPVRIASSMDEAVTMAASLARPGDAVLLSPGCASFDWYRSYGERGDDFARAVRARVPAGAQHGRQK